MGADFMTVVWKEWKEILLQRSGGGGGRPLILIAVIGILMPLRMGPQRYFGPVPLLVLLMVAMAAISAVVADAFAGERERHTLETLLASSLSDRAILFGKIAACVAYGWLIWIVCVLLGTVTVNVVNWQGHIQIFHDAISWLLFLLGPPLVGSAVATAGVFVSLHAATVRAAQQTLAGALAVLFIGATFAISSLPERWKAQVLQILITWSPWEWMLLAAGIVLAVDALLVLAAMARFQRSRLVLD